MNILSRRMILTYSAATSSLPLTPTYSFATFCMFSLMQDSTRGCELRFITYHVSFMASTG